MNDDATAVTCPLCDGDGIVSRDELERPGISGNLLGLAIALFYGFALGLLAMGIIWWLT